MKRAVKWLLPALGLAHLLLIRSGFLDWRAVAGLAVALEGLLLAVAVSRLAVAARAFRRHPARASDPWLALEDGLATVLPRRVAWLMALEPRLWHCLWRWLARRGWSGESDFPYQRRAAVGAVLVLAIFTMPAEVLAFELLIPWPWLRVLLAFGSVYSLFWLFGFYASLRVLPHRLEADGLRVRFGAFSEGFLLYADIGGIAIERRRSPGGRDGLRVAPRRPVAYLATGGRTDVTIRLRAPRPLRRWGNWTAPVTTVCVATDEPERLAQALGRRTGVPVTGAASERATPPRPTAYRLQAC